MLKRHRVCLALLCSIWPTIPTAQAVQTSPSPGGTDEAEHEAIRRLKSGYEDAVRNNRIDALAPYFQSLRSRIWQAPRGASLVSSGSCEPDPWRADRRRLATAAN